MKPFVAVAVLVAASLSAASAAPAQHQQVAQGSRAGGVGVGPRPSFSGSLQSQNGAPGFGGSVFFGAQPAGWALGAFPGGTLGAPSSASPSLSAPGGASRPGSSAATGSQLGSSFSQVPSSGSYVFGQHPVFYPGQSYVPSVYGQNPYGGVVSWGYGPAYWGGNGYGNNYGGGYGGVYGGGFPTGFGQFSYGFGGPSYGGFVGQVGAGQTLAAGSRSSASSARGSRSQRPARSQ